MSLTQLLAGITATVCLVVSALVVSVYRTRFPWKSTPAGIWILLAFTLLTARHTITALDTWLLPPHVTDSLIAVWNVTAFGLYLGLLVWMVTVPNDPTNPAPSKEDPHAPHRH